MDNKQNKILITEDNEIVSLNTSAESSDNPVFIFRDNSLVYLNPKFVTEFNLSKKKISDIKIKDLINDEDCEKLISEINKCLDFKSKNFRISCKIKSVSEKLKQYDIFGSLIDFEGSPAVQCNLYDISGTKEIISQINIAEKEYSDILQMLPVGICKMDLYGKIIYSNNSLSKLSEYTAEELKGKFLWEVIGNPDNSTLIMDILKKLREEYSKPFSIFTENFTKNGKPYKTELKLDYINDSEQRNIGFICLFIDITAREAAQNSYEESEKKLKAIAEVMSDWVWEIDIEGYYTFASPKVFDILGYTPEEIIGKKPEDFLKESEILKVSEFIRNLMIKRNYFKDYLNICKHKNGSEVFIETSGIPVYDDEGNFKGYFGIDRNITEIISKERELSETQKRLNILLENNSEVAVYEFESGDDYISGNLNSMLGYNISKLKTKENLYSIINPDDIARAKALKDKWFENKTSNPLVTEFRLLNKYGNYIWFQDRSYFIRKESREYYVIGLLININERKKKDDETRGLISALNQMPYIIIIIDTGGKISFVNKYFEKETGLGDEVVKGKHISAIFSDFNSEIINCLLKTVYNSKTYNSNIISFNSVNGETLRKHITLSPILDEDNNITSYILTLNDANETDNRYDELVNKISKAEELHNTKLVLLRSLSHEFRTPMNSILGFTEILRDSKMESKQKKMIKGIEVSAKKLLKTTDSILKLTELEIIANILNPEAINLSEVLSRIFKSFLPEIQEKNLQYEIQIPDSKLYIYTNYFLLEQSVSNIIDNAVKFTYSGRISLNVDTFENNGKRFALITVKDTGIGIPTDKIDYIFRDSENESVNYSSHFEGTGLGLTLSKKIIEIMNGSIKVDSHPDVGTTVTIIFPLTTNQRYGK